MNNGSSVGNGAAGTHRSSAGIGVLGTGASLPATILTNAVLEKRLNLSAGTIESLLGVRERRVAHSDQATSDLAVEAGNMALRDAGVHPSEVRLLILATSTPDHPVPATAPSVAHRLGLACPAFDLMNTCSGFLYALEVARRWIAGGTESGVVLVIASNVLSRRLNWSGEWSTAALFGDGAGAVVVGPVEVGGIQAVRLAADGAHHDSIQVPAGGSRKPLSAELVQSGQHLLQIQRRPGMRQDSLGLLLGCAQGVLSQCAWTGNQVDWFLPHQANARLPVDAAQELGIPGSRTLGHLQRYGNLSAASIPVMLHEAARAGQFSPGSRILLAGVGAGMSAGAAVLEWSKAARAPLDGGSP